MAIAPIKNEESKVNKWIVTGGAGFIGSVLIWKLNQEGIDDIWVVDRVHRAKNLNGKTFKDYLDAEAFLKAVTGDKLPAIDGIVHLGATTSTTETDAGLLRRNNLEYSQALASWALGKNKRFVYASSAATYGDGSHGYSTDPSTTRKLKPLNLYGNSKQLFDLWALDQGILDRVVGIKFFNIYGPNEYHKEDMRSVVAKAYDQIQAHGQVQLFKSYRPDFADGEQQRDFLYVKDAVQAVYEFMTQPRHKGIYNLGSGQARSWNDLARAIFAALGKPARIEYIEMPESLRQRYQYHTQADMRWRRTDKSAAPFRSLEEGVRDYVQNHLSKEDRYL
jgi:ADP-L-glycero-D-manno-heptose 6-epimerase